MSRTLINIAAVEAQPNNTTVLGSLKLKTRVEVVGQVPTNTHNVTTIRSFCGLVGPRARASSNMTDTLVTNARYYAAAHQPQHYNNDNSVYLTLALGQFYISVCLDFGFWSRGPSFGSAIERPLRSLRRWRCEGFFLLAWLLHVCIIWTLKLVEASQVAGAKGDAG